MFLEYGCRYRANRLKCLSRPFGELNYDVSKNLEYSLLWPERYWAV